MEHNTLNGKINNSACETEMEKAYAKYDQNGVSSPQTLEAEQEFKQAHELVTELDRALAFVLDGIVGRLARAYEKQGFKAGYIAAGAISEEVPNKVSRLTDSLFGITDLEEISYSLSGIADLLTAVSSAQESGNRFRKGIFFLQGAVQDLAYQLQEYVNQAFEAAKAAAKS